MKPRLVRPANHTEPQARLRRIISCHEAAHAIAAYHLLFPFTRVRYTEPQGLHWEINALEPDNDSLGVTWCYLQHCGATSERIAVSFGTVLLIGFEVNVHVNGARVEEAEAGAGSDRQQLQDWFQQQGYDDPQKTYLRQRIDEEVHRVRNLPGFRESLDPVAAALIATGSLSTDEVSAVIEQAVGQQLRNPAPLPTHDNLSLAAYYRYIARVPGSADANQDWFAAEKGLRFGFALHV